MRKFIEQDSYTEKLYCGKKWNTCVEKLDRRYYFKRKPKF